MADGSSLRLVLMNWLDVVSILLISAGLFFFLGGTVGLLRFPDVYSRIHALTKADNLGLGFIIMGLAIHSQSFAEALKLFFIWILVLVASSTVGYLIGRNARLHGIEPWKKDA
jgi:multicomponent Na+:H+ antiporter subunit G